MFRNYSDLARRVQRLEKTVFSATDRVTNDGGPGARSSRGADNRPSQDQESQWLEGLLITVYHSTNAPAT